MLRCKAGWARGSLLTKPLSSSPSSSSCVRSLSRLGSRGGSRSHQQPGAPSRLLQQWRRPGLHRPPIEATAWSTSRALSTESAPPTVTAEATSSIPEVAENPTGDSLQDILKEFSEAVPSEPDTIGYLHSLGLDYGWGPTSVMQWILEHIHVWGGAPWWLSIVLTALIVRVGFLKPVFLASDTTARLNAVKPATAPFMDHMKEARRLHDQNAVLKAKQDVGTIYRRADIHLWRTFLPILQAIPGFGAYRLLGGMTRLPVPGMDSAGVLWFQDLTLSDPYYILPIATGLLFYRVMALGGKNNSSTMSPGAYKAMCYLIPTVTSGFMLGWPAALQLSFAFNGMFGLLQSTALATPWFRDLVGISPLPVPPRPSGASGGSAAPEGFGSLNVDHRYRNADGTASDAYPAAPLPAVAEKAKGVVGGAVAEVQGVVSEVQKTWKGVTGGSTKSGERSSSEKRQAQAYEEKRQREIAQQRWDLERQKYDRWLEKQEQKHKRNLER